MTHHTDAKGGLFGDEKLYVRLTTLADAQRLVQVSFSEDGCTERQKPTAL